MSGGLLSRIFAEFGSQLGAFHPYFFDFLFPASPVVLTSLDKYGFSHTGTVQGVAIERNERIRTVS